MFAAMAELEASTITERVMTGKRTKAGEGGYNGSRIPYGYSYADGKWETTDQTETVREIFALFLAGNSLKGIADQLNSEGTPTATGKRWAHETIKYLLRNDVYAGVAQWAGVEAAGSTPAIVSKEDYEAAQTRLEGLKRGRRWH